MDRPTIAKTIISQIKKMRDDESYTSDLLCIPPKAKLIRTWHLDSLDILDLQFRLEHIFKVNLEWDKRSDAFMKRLTFGDVVDEIYFRFHPPRFIPV